MKLLQCVALLACSPLAHAVATADADHAVHNNLEPPTKQQLEYDLCRSDCSLHGVAFPDKDTLQLPLEDFVPERCPQTYIGRYDKPNATSNVCLDFAGQFLTFTFAPFPGYTTKSAIVHWKLAGNTAYPKSYALPPPDHTAECSPEGNGNFVCKIPFNNIVGLDGHAGLTDVLHGMCPNDDREGLTIYLAFSGTVVVPAYPHKEIHFQQQYPCKPGSRDKFRRCTSLNSSQNHLQISYRCSKCTVDPCPPPCEYGTAYGYQSPQASYDLDTQNGTECKKSWGWLETPSLKLLKTGISGTLYVRTNAGYFEEVGTWHASADAYDKVKVKYRIWPGLPYSLGQVNVDLACLAVDSCVPEDFTYNYKWLGDVSEYEARDLKFPKCLARSRAYLVVSAEINTIVTKNQPKTSLGATGLLAASAAPEADH
ncbi:hypothetical protein QBC42DRAFT_174774 [Cladorrhinum samala]|uniref:Uncharacterized protein n=1 Tax=Cladorrhinum samala TaxID=585594 RepID=A0AAV9HPX4_9PEZI|nr:hypothetical protein QBC42DRAFT_174774 [Cladorrhinum samala]